MFEINKERIYLHSPAAYIVMTVRRAEGFELERLERAINQAASERDMLACRARLLPDGRAEFVPGELVHMPLEQTDMSESEIIASQAKRPFASDGGEWMRNFLTSDGAWLIAFNHLAGDGMALTAFAETALSYLDDPRREPKRYEVRLLDPKSLPGKLNFLMRLGLRGVNVGWKKRGRAFDFSDRARLNEKYWAGRTLYTDYFELDEAKLNRLLALCKSAGLGLNGAFAAALPMEWDAGFTVNIRGGDAGYMGNWSTGVTVKRGEAGLAFRARARDMQAALQAKLDSQKEKFFLAHFMNAIAPALADAAYYAAFDGFENKSAHQVSDMFGYSDKPHGYTISNMLRMDIPAKIAIYPPLVPNAGAVIGLVTSEGTLAATMQSFYPCEGALKGAFERIEKELG